MYNENQIADIVKMYTSGISIIDISLKHKKGTSSIVALLCRQGVYKTMHKPRNNMQVVCVYCKSKLFSNLIECANCGAPV